MGGVGGSLSSTTNWKGTRGERGESVKAAGWWLLKKIVAFGKMFQAEEREENVEVGEDGHYAHAYTCTLKNTHKHAQPR